MQLNDVDSRSIAVVGVGYVGLTAAACLAYLGHRVVAVDIDDDRIAGLKRGMIPIHEARLPELVADGIATERLSFTTDLPAALPSADFVFLCVATPPRPDGHADLSFLDIAVDQLRAVLPEAAVVVLKSTVPVGTNQRVAERLARPDVSVVSNPEFLREGLAVDDFLDADRVVVGSTDRAAAAAVAELYGDTPTHVLSTDPATAELVKYATNAFLASRLSFVNELAAIAATVGGRIDDIVAGLGMDHRIGKYHLSPGPGWGGSCFPKDIRSLQATAADAGVEVRLLDAVIAANEDQFDRVAEMVVAAMGGSAHDARVGVLGLTFKAGTDDLRDSPSLAVIDRLAAMGAHMVAFDPIIDTSPAPYIELAPDAVSVAIDADALVVLTEWPEFAELELDAIATAMRGDTIVDARNVLDARAVEKAGLHYTSVGRSAV
jgi:UDPglucose 6-dehydrogenase